MWVMHGARPPGDGGRAKGRVRVGDANNRHTANKRPC
jgi:hypothetical protein